MIEHDAINWSENSKEIFALRNFSKIIEKLCKNTEDSESVVNHQVQLRKWTIKEDEEREL